VIDFLGIARERVYSPGKVDDDRAILEAVAAHLSAAHRVTVVSADQPLPEVAAPTLVFAMCQGPAALATLRRWEASGVRVINSVAGIENAHRRRMLAAFAQHRVAHPESLLLASREPGSLPDWVDQGAWLKRGDVHATEPDDVVRVADHAAARAALAAFARRGIASALLQRHVSGGVIKFYAVRDGAFFAAFAGDGGRPGLSAPAYDAMRRLAESAAAAVGLEVFGGDCVCNGEENLSLIDLNDWPSYGRCRPGAAAAIASYLQRARSQ
jgi:glutathione synthase/RimK-type ligase-like ATP-grasp enzyme